MGDSGDKLLWVCRLPLAIPDARDIRCVVVYIFGKLGNIHRQGWQQCVQVFLKIIDIRVFAFDIGGNLPHGDAAGPHKNQCVHGGKAHTIYCPVQRQKARLFKTRHGIAHPYLLRQRLQYPPRRGTAAPAEGKQGGSHCAPLRNSVVKSGWYSRERR